MENGMYASALQISKQFVSSVTVFHRDIEEISIYAGIFRHDGEL